MTIKSEGEFDKHAAAAGAATAAAAALQNCY